MRPSGAGRTFLCLGVRVWEYLVAGRNWKLRPFFTFMQVVLVIFL